MLHIHSSVDVTCKYTFAFYIVDVSTIKLHLYSSVDVSTCICYIQAELNVLIFV